MALRLAEAGSARSGARSGAPPAHESAAGQPHGRLADGLLAAGLLQTLAARSGCCLDGRRADGLWADRMVRDLSAPGPCATVYGTGTPRRRSSSRLRCSRSKSINFERFTEVHRPFKYCPAAKRPASGARRQPISELDLRFASWGLEARLPLQMDLSDAMES